MLRNSSGRMNHKIVGGRGGGELTEEPENLLKVLDGWTGLQELGIWDKDGLIFPYSREASTHIPFWT